MQTIATTSRPLFAYIDGAIIDCRLRGIYNLCRSGNFVKAQDNAMDTLMLLEKTPIIDINHALYMEMVDGFRWINTRFVLGDYRNVHAHVRDLHFRIFAEDLE